MPWDAPVVGGKSWIDFANRDENHSRVADDAVFAPPAWRRKTRVRTCSSCIQVRILIMVEFWERDAGLKLVPELGGGSLLGVPCEILPWAGSILNNWSLWPIVRFVSRAVICQTWTCRTSAFGWSSRPWWRMARLLRRGRVVIIQQPPWSWGPALPDSRNPKLWNRDLKLSWGPTLALCIWIVNANLQALALDNKVC